MTARVTAVGAHCRAGPDGEGWSVVAILPRVAERDAPAGLPIRAGSDRANGAQAP